MTNTNSTDIRILLVEDDEYDQFAFLRAVKQQELAYDTVVAETVAEARQLLSNQIFDIGVIDFNIGSDTAFALFDDLKEMPFIIATGAGDEELAVQAMKMGAYDYIVKDIQGNYLKTLDLILQNAIQRKHAEDELKDYRENLEILVKERTKELSKANEQLRHEILERKQAEEMIRLQATAMTAAANGIIITDLNGKIIWVNPALSQILGLPEENLIGKSISKILINPFGGELHPSFTDAIENETTWSDEISNKRDDGSFYTVEVTTTPVYNKQNQISHFTTILHDVTERVKSQKLMEFMATHDNLTNLPNRLLFRDRTNHAIANARRNGGKLAVLFLDLDDFKAVNDAFSHARGDEVLISVSNQISDCLREMDTVARFGGDEFAILLENIANPEAAAQVSKKIIKEISRPISILGNQYSISASIGISVYPDDGSQASQLIQNSDAAMYRSKERGKNTYQFYTPDMTKEVQDRLRIISQLKTALKEDTLELYFQPQIEVPTRKISGLEALLRFCAPGRGFISPEIFIPIAEKAGMIVEIGNWVLNKACLESQKLAEQGFDVQLSVNISGKQLNHPSLVATVAKTIDNSGIQPDTLVLEITENSMFENIDFAIDVIRNLKMLGVKIALDDFGTGYSSLGYLTQIELDIIKIDKSFAHNIIGDPNRIAVVQGIVAIAHALDVPMVIEGVETEEQHQFFAGLGCQIIQGFLFSPPVPIHQLTVLLTKGFDHIL
jgi:diguanylate cyclase (GGDEF)-like protein/PAS domain S-box-containing protein